MSDERRKGLDEVMDHLKGIQGTLDRQNVALFAKTDDNEFGTPGVMTVMQKVDQHINVLCGIAHTTKKVLKTIFWLVGGIGTVAGTIAAAAAVGWITL